MNQRDFIIWLQGYLEGENPKVYNIQEKLKNVEICEEPKYPTGTFSNPNLFQQPWYYMEGLK